MSESGHILLVDDLPTNRMMMKAALGEAGHTFDEAGDGEEALVRLREGAYDLVVLDHQMPGMSGLDVLKSVRASTDREALPVMIVSGEEDDAAAADFIAAGANDYVTKPYDFTVLAQRVATLIGYKKALDALARIGF